MSINQTTTSSVTVALKIGSKFMGIGWRVTRIDPDNGSVVPVEKDGVAYVPAKAVAEAFGGAVTGDTVTIGGRSLSLRDALVENGAALLPVSAFAQSFGFFARYYPDAPYAEGVIVLSNEFFYTAVPMGANTINPVTIHAVALLLARVRETREYISIELPKAFYELADPGQDKGVSEKFTRDVAHANINEDLYPIPAEAEKKDGVPVGAVTKIVMDNCRTYPGVSHNIWTYVPAQYDGKTPLNLIIFTDGDMFFRDGSQWPLKFEMPTVLDNMIHEGQIPPTAALFIAPGTPGDGYPVWGKLGPGSEDNRSTELDAVDERYPNFLFEEVIPSVFRDVALTSDPNKRVIWGVSSGGSASLNAVWRRTDQVATAIMACSSIAWMRMSGLYQFALRNQPRKDIRVVLMGGENDHTGTRWGNWPNVTQMVGDSLAYSGYKHLYLMSKGGHSYEWVARLTPKLLRCLWKGEEFSADYVEIRSRNGI